MKILGLIGGTSWISTIDYYRQISLLFNQKLGGSDYGKCVIYSMNYQQIINYNSKGDFESTYKVVKDAAVNLKLAGAEAIVICANTLHMFASRIEEEVKLPLVNIVKATADEIAKQGLTKVGLLGTKATMEMPFYKEILWKNGIETIVPEVYDRHFVHEKIFSELGKDILKLETKAEYLTIINKLLRQGAQGIILGCTEIPLLINQTDCSYPLFDTTVIHSKAAVDFALSEFRG
ncbi:MAG TPA: amino acid racemase [Bacteroidia bacterium]|nr:amino acid racemase [Bacteroidia bacterium]